MKKNKTILITGANGLLGSRLCGILAKSGFKVYGIVRRQTKPQKSVTFIKKDLSKPLSTRNLPRSLYAIIHLAQSNKYKKFPAAAFDIFCVNTMSTAFLLNFAFQTNTKKFLYASTGGLYGFGKRPFRESSLILNQNNINFYLASKTCGELLVQSYSKFFETKIIRPFFIFGPGQKKQMLIPRLISLIKKRKPVLLEGKNGVSINPIFVDDAAIATKNLLLSKKTGIFNLAGASKISIRQLSNIVSNAFGVRPKFLIKSQTKNKLIGDISKIKEYFPKYKKYSLKKQLLRIVAK